MYLKCRIAYGHNGSDPVRSNSVIYRPGDHRLNKPAEQKIFNVLETSLTDRVNRTGSEFYLLNRQEESLQKWMHLDWTKARKGVYDYETGELRPNGAAPGVMSVHICTVLIIAASFGRVLTN